MDKNNIESFSNKALKATILEYINECGEIKHAEFILHMIYMRSSVKINSENITKEEFDKVLDSYYQVRYMPRYTDLKYLDELKFYNNKDVRKDITIDGQTYSIAKLYKSLINDILQENPSLLTLGKKAVRYDDNGIIILDNLLHKDIEKGVEERLDENYHISFNVDIDKNLNLKSTITNYVHSIDSDTRNVFINSEEFKEENIRKPLKISITKNRPTKKARIIEYYKFGMHGQTLSYKQIAELTNTTDKYVKKAVYENNLKIKIPKKK